MTGSSTQRPATVAELASGVAGGAVTRAMSVTETCVPEFMRPRLYVTVPLLPTGLAVSRPAA